MTNSLKILVLGFLLFVGTCCALMPRGGDETEELAYREKEAFHQCLQTTQNFCHTSIPIVAFQDLERQLHCLDISLDICESFLRGYINQDE